MIIFMMQDYEEIRSRVMSAMRATFKPEFMNRVDEYIVFTPLDQSQITSIVRLQLDRVAKRLKDKKISLDVSEEAILHLSEVRNHFHFR